MKPARPALDLPASEQQLLHGAVGEICNTVSLIGMSDCGEEDVPAMLDRGFYELTWGAAFRIGAASPAISCAEDELGDPFRISISEASRLAELDTAVPQEVSDVSPWNSVIGAKLQAIAVHTYESNYWSEKWYAVPWGIELQFGSGTTFLFGALHHGDSESLGVTSDEIVVAWSPKQIQKIRRIYSSIRNRWTKSEQ